MTVNYDNLPDHLRTAGVAWVITESIKNDSDITEIRSRAHHWAIMRGLAIETPDDHDMAAADAAQYAHTHESDVEEFLAVRRRLEERGAG